MTRRGVIAPALGTLMAACSPLGLLNSLGPRDGGARRVSRDLSYGDHPRQRFDLYAPDGPGPWPVLVFFYGGNWDSGERGLYAWAAQALAARGFVVAVPDYRLVPEAHFPAFVQDAARATARVGHVARDHGGDPGRLGVIGHSAGAYLAMMIALDRRYMTAAGAPDLIRAAAGLAGPYDFPPQDFPSTRAAFGQERNATLTQPVAFVRRDAPPIWLGHGTADTVVHDEDSILLDRGLRSAGASSTLTLYDGLNHVDMVTALSPLFRGKAPVLDDVTRFFQGALTRPVSPMS